MKEYKYICIVDDEKIFATIQIDRLREDGKIVQYFDSIASFMNDISENSIHQYDLIVLDRYFIPEDYDSLEDGLAAQLKSEEHYGYKGDIFLWTNGSQQQKESFEKGFDAFLPKSVLLSDKI